MALSPLTCCSVTAQFRAGDQGPHNFFAPQVVRRSSAGCSEKVCRRAEKYSFFLPEQLDLGKMFSSQSGQGIKGLRLSPALQLPSPSRWLPYSSTEESLKGQKKQEEEYHGAKQLLFK